MPTDCMKVAVDDVSFDSMSIPISIALRMSRTAREMLVVIKLLSIVHREGKRQSHLQHLSRQENQIILLKTNDNERVSSIVLPNCHRFLTLKMIV